MTQPAGPVTFLFADLEGSTQHLTSLGDTRYADLLAQFRSLVRVETAPRAGREVDAQGDQVFLAFPEPTEALAAAIGIQRALAAGAWPDGRTVRARIGLHTGRPVATGSGYVGIDVHRAARICAAGHGGQILISEAMRDLLERMPSEEAALRDLGLHRLKDLTRPQRLYQVIAAGLTTDFPMLRTLDAHPNNLPVQLSSFVGRTQEIAEIKARLHDTRLVTLTGPGGCGKTRLALQVAADLSAEHPDGTWLVELASVTDPVLVASAACATVGGVEQPGRSSIDTLTEFLSTKQALLVLDNCEHLVDACADIVNRMLPQAPRLRVMATSREGLGVPGEALYPVHPLALPAPDQPARVEQALQAESVQLFRERAVAASPAFSLSPSNVLAITDICRCLDGIPLGIELAASLVQAMSPSEIAERVRGEFRLRAGTSRRAVSRHQTMQAALDWSYGLLSKPERRLLRRLSVFSGSWTAKAAQAIGSGGGLAGSDVPDLLTQLVVKSMVAVVVREEQSRYRLLETVREYARGKLLATRNAKAVHERHLLWYADLAEHLAPTVNVFYIAATGPGGHAIRAGIEDEYRNLLEALAWSMDTGRADATARLLRVLGPFWARSGRWEEEDLWYRKLLDAIPIASPHRPGCELRAAKSAYRRGDLAGAEVLLESTLRARERIEPLWVVEALSLMAQLAWHRGDLRRVEALSYEGLSIAEGTGDRIGTAYMQTELGSLAAARGHYDQAIAWHERSLAIFRDVGSLEGLGLQLRKLGNLLRFQGNYDRALILAEEAVRTDRQLESDWSTSYSLHVLGQIHHDRGNYEEATLALEEALALARRLGHKSGTGLFLQALARVALDRAAFDRAGALLRESLALQQGAGLKDETVRTLGTLGTLARYRGDLDEAARLLGESVSIARETGDRRPLSMTLCELGIVMLHRGDRGHAKHLLRESLDLLKTGIWTLALVKCVEAASAVLEAEGRADQAIHLLASAARARGSMATPVPPVDRPEYESLQRRLRACLGEEPFEISWRAGTSTDLENAADRARTTLSLPAGESAG